jgi:hypothetical protein
MKLLYIIGFLGCFLPSMTFAGVLNCFDTAKRGLQASQGQLELMADNIPNILIGQQGLRETHLRERREFIRQGIESGRLNQVDASSRQSLLTLAISEGFRDLVLLLIEKGENIEGVPGEIAFPLGKAIICGRFDSIEVLIGHGADVNRKYRIPIILEIGGTTNLWGSLLDREYTRFKDRDRNRFLLLIEYGANLSAEILDDIRINPNFKAKVEEAQGKVAGCTSSYRMRLNITLEIMNFNIL